MSADEAGPVGPARGDPLLGRVIAGKLELTQLLGSGAMGKVYRAHHRGLDKTVAIKVLHRSDTIQPDLVRRFQAEARAASRLDHPNSLRILDFGEDGDDHLLYIAMEFLDGEDLAGALRREGRIESTRAAEIMVQVLAALAVAHQEGVVHRDMKPGNIMLLPRTDENGAHHDVVKVCDFGLAKILDTPLEDAKGAPLTKQGMIMGTPAFMSPEQATGSPLDGLSDVYSCGVILYQMLTGRVPFTSESTAGVLIKHLTEPPKPILELAPDANPELAAIAHRAMAKDKAERPTAREMMVAVRGVLTGERTEHPWMPRVPSAVSAPPRSASAVGQTPTPRTSSTSNPPPGFDAPHARTPAALIDAAPSLEPRPLIEPRPRSEPRPLGDPHLAGASGQTDSASAALVPVDGSRRWTVVSAVVGSVALLVAGVAVAFVVSKSDRPVETTPLGGDSVQMGSATPSAADKAASPDLKKGTETKGGARPGKRPSAGERGSGTEETAMREPASGADAGSGAEVDLTPPIPSGDPSGGNTGNAGTGAAMNDPAAIEAGEMAANGTPSMGALPDAGVASPDKLSPGTVSPTSPATRIGLGKAEPGLRTGDKVGLGGKLTLPLHPKVDAGVAGSTEPTKTEPTLPAKTEPEAPKTVEPAKSETKSEPVLSKPTITAPNIGPKKLGADFHLDASMTDLQVTGGLSVNRSSAALERYVSAAKDCLRGPITKLGVETKGTFEVSARIDQYGALRDLVAKGPISGAESCIAGAFASARLPKPDTGDATLRFALKYSATP